MPLRLELVAPSNIPIEVEGLTPDLVRGLSPARIEKLAVQHGNRELPLAELFRVRGDASDERIELAGDLSGVHWIGARMACGDIRVTGPAGRHLGSDMGGGQVRVDGPAGDWVGAEMRGGLIHVRGDAGNNVGAAYRGSAQGMTGGAILIEGSAGNEIGRTMRKGLVAIGGAAGDFPAMNMIAGTVLVFGACGARPAAGMRRGSLVLFQSEAPPLLPTFQAGGVCRLAFLRLYLRRLAAHGFPLPADTLDADFQLHHGDLLALGRGEVLIRT